MTKQYVVNNMSKLHNIRMSKTLTLKAAALPNENIENWVTLSITFMNQTHVFDLLTFELAL